MAQSNWKPWLPTGYMTAEKAAFTFNIPERYMINPKNERRKVLHKTMAWKGLCHCSEGEKKTKGAGHISKDSSDDLDVHVGLAGGGAKKTKRKANETDQWMSGGLAVEDRCASPTQPCSPGNVAVSSFDLASMIRASGRGWS